jgi:threonine dehydrogenase-like Zn-dependent dehydrogenase
VRVVATCVCGSDLWNYRGINEFSKPRLIGHEGIGEVVTVGPEVGAIKPGDFVVIPFDYCCGRCPHCLAGFHNACVRGGVFGQNQSEFIRVPQADGSLVATPEAPAPEQLADLLALSDVMATGWHAAVSAGVGRHADGTVVVVGDGAVGLSGILAASTLGARRIVAMSRNPARQELARWFGATDIVPERGVEGVQAILDLTDGVGADATLECVGTNDSMRQAIGATRPGSTVGYVGVPHGVQLPIGEMFSTNVGVAGGQAPVRAYLPRLLDLVLGGGFHPGAVFDLTVPLDDVAEAYRAMDERRAIKALLLP